MNFQGILICLFLFLTPTLQASITKPSNVLEVYFVVDKRAIDRYEGLSTASTAAARLADSRAKATADIDYIITEVNKIYSSLTRFGDFGHDIQIARRKVDFLETNIFPDVMLTGGNIVNSQHGLDTFGDYLKSENAFQRLKYDVALLWTGFDLSSTSHGSRAAGKAYIGNVCQSEKATAVVEFDGSYQTVMNTAHELGHSLGSTHDAVSTSNIMGPSAGSTSLDRWKFSLCTASHIRGTIDQLESNCLLTTDPASVIPSSDITDNLQDPNTMCQLWQNDTDSYMCMGTALYKGQRPAGDAVCNLIYCHTYGTYCHRTLTPDGMYCGKGKSCRQGKCVDDTRPEAQKVDDECVFGDQAIVTFKYQPSQTCSELIMSKPSNCYKEDLYNRCCATCKQLSTGIAGCEWGDKSSFCRTSSCTWYSERCCKTCHSETVVGKRSQDTDSQGLLDLESLEEDDLDLVDEQDGDNPDNEDPID